MPYQSFGSSCDVQVSRQGPKQSADRYLWRREEVERLLVGGIGLLELVLHEVTAAERGPYFAVLGLDLERALEVLDGLGRGARRRERMGINDKRSEGDVATRRDYRNRRGGRNGREARGGEEACERDAGAMKGRAGPRRE